MADPSTDTSQPPGQEPARDLLPLVYDELRRRAANAMRDLPPGQTLQPTALVHEAYAKLSNGQQKLWRDERHFLAVATHAVRSLVIDRIRARKRLKRGGGSAPQPLHDGIPVATPPFDDDLVLAIDDCIDRLRTLDPRAAEVVVLRVHMDLTEREIAGTLNLSERTIRRDWTFARTWLMKELRHTGIHRRSAP